LYKVTDDISDLWVEVNSQILNSCFTIAAFYNQPYRAYYMFILLKRSHERLHPTIGMLYPWATLQDKTKLIFILIIQNLNCIFQYPIVVMMWGYNYKVRPVWVIPVFLPLSFGCAIAGGLIPFWYQRKVEKRRKLDMESGGEPNEDPGHGTPYLNRIFDDRKVSTNTPPLLRKDTSKVNKVIN